MRIASLFAVAALLATEAVAQGLDLPSQTNREARSLDDPEGPATDNADAAEEAARDLKERLNRYR